MNILQKMKFQKDVTELADKNNVQVLNFDWLKTKDGNYVCKIHAVFKETSATTEGVRK